MRCLGLVVAASVLVALMPSAEAQTLPPPDVKLKFGTYSQYLLPETETAEIAVTLAMTCNGQENPAMPYSFELKRRVIPPYANVFIAPATGTHTFQPGTCPPGHVHEFKSVLKVSATRDAPAYSDAPIELTGTVKRDGDKLAEVTESMPIKIEYLPGVEIRPNGLSKRAPQNTEVIFQIDFTNLANGPTRITLNATPMSNFRLESINPGSELRLESRAEKGAAAMFRAYRSVEVQTPDAGGTAAFALNFEARFDGTADGRRLYDEQTVTFTVHVAGTLGGDAPAPPLVWLLAFLVFAAAWKRQR